MDSELDSYFAEESFRRYGKKETTTPPTTDINPDLNTWRGDYDRRRNPNRSTNRPPSGPIENGVFARSLFDENSGKGKKIKKNDEEDEEEEEEYFTESPGDSAVTDELIRLYKLMEAEKRKGPSNI